MTEPPFRDTWITGWAQPGTCEPCRRRRRALRKQALDSARQRLHGGDKA